jgi:glycosyltransferase involved in cell wall biosynthesis
MKISVVIPTHNYGHYLGFAIDSVLAQTRFPEEIIVVDDGSTDNTRDIAARYVSKIRYVYQNNAGLSAARNTGTAAASGDWVAYLDSDDAWKPGKLEAQEAAILRTPGAVVAYTGALLMQPDGAVSEAIPAMPGEQIWPLLRCRNIIPASSSMARRASVLEVGGFNEELRACEDWDLWVRLKFKGSFAAVAEPLTVIRQTPQSMSSSTQRMLDNMEAIRETALLHGLSGFSRTLWTRRIRSVAQMHAAFTVDDESRLQRAHLVQSILYWPNPLFEFRRYRALLRNLIGASAYKRVSAIVGHRPS